MPKTSNIIKNTYILEYENLTDRQNNATLHYYDRHDFSY